MTPDDKPTPGRDGMRLFCPDCGAQLPSDINPAGDPKKAITCYFCFTEVTKPIMRKLPAEMMNVGKTNTGSKPAASTKPTTSVKAIETPKSVESPKTLPVAVPQKISQPAPTLKPPTISRANETPKQNVDIKPKKSVPIKTSRPEIQKAPKIQANTSSVQAPTLKPSPGSRASETPKQNVDNKPKKSAPTKTSSPNIQKAPVIQKKASSVHVASPKIIPVAVKKISSNSWKKTTKKSSKKSAPR